MAPSAGSRLSRGLRTTGGATSFGAGVVPQVVEGGVHSRDSGGCWDPAPVLPLLTQPCVAAWGPAPASRPPPHAGPSPGSHRNQKLQIRCQAQPCALCLLLCSSVTNPRAVDHLSSCLGLVQSRTVCGATSQLFCAGDSLVLSHSGHLT